MLNAAVPGGSKDSLMEQGLVREHAFMGRRDSDGPAIQSPDPLGVLTVHGFGLAAWDS